MIPAVYISETNYLQSCATIASKIAAIDAIIDALFAQQLVLAQQGTPVMEYMLNDGQTTIKAIYRTTESIIRTISALEGQRNYYANKGRRNVHMIDSKNLIGPFGR